VGGERRLSSIGIALGSCPDDGGRAAKRAASDGGGEVCRVRLERESSNEDAESEWTAEGRRLGLMDMSSPYRKCFSVEFYGNTVVRWFKAN